MTAHTFLAEVATCKVYDVVTSAETIELLFMGDETVPDEIRVLLTKKLVGISVHSNERPPFLVAHLGSISVPETTMGPVVLKSIEGIVSKASTMAISSRTTSTLSRSACSGSLK
eukprot:2857835-Amphidinium_carterae.1